VKSTVNFLFDDNNKKGRHWGQENTFYVEIDQKYAYGFCMKRFLWINYYKHDGGAKL
jgi:hypothetical protein